MRVEAIAVLTLSQICRIHDRLANLTAFAWWESNYRTPFLTISDNGSFTAVGETREKNFCMVEFNMPSSTMRLYINSRRHALSEVENSAGAVFDLLELDVLEAFDVLEYDSWRKDRPFWDYDLTPTPKRDYERKILGEYFKKWMPELYGTHHFVYDPVREVMVFCNPLNYEEAGDGKPATSFLSEVDRRRLTFKGVEV